MLILVIVCLMAQFWIVWRASCVSSADSQVYTMQDIDDVNQYEYSDNEFTVTGEDPQIIWKPVEHAVRTVTLNFSKPFDQDTTFEFYYGIQNRFNPKWMYHTTIHAGESSCEVMIQNPCYNTFRTDIDSGFFLDSVTIVTWRHSVGLVCVWTVVFLLLDGVAVWLYRRKTVAISQKIDQWRQRWNPSIPKLFVIWGFVAGMTVSILIPAGQLPDEWAHVRMISDEWGLTGYGNSSQDVVQSVISLDDVHDVYGQKMDVGDYLAAMNQVRYGEGCSKTIRPNYLLVRHITASVGYLAGVFLNLPVLWCLQLAEFTALAGYLVMGYYALKWMPFKKECMALIMLLPMTLQQAASVNYDSIAFGISFMLIAYILRMKYRDDKVGWSKLFAVVVMVVILLITKLPYACLGLLVFTVPHDKYDFKIGRVDLGQFAYRFRYLLLAAVIVLFAVGIVFIQGSMYLNSMKAAVIKFPVFAHLILRSFQLRGGWYIGGMLGCLGWLDTPLSGGQYLVICLMAIWLSQAGSDRTEAAVHKTTHKVTFRVAAFGIALLIFVLIFASMLSWTTMIEGWETPQTLQQWKDSLLNMDNIYGVQGRYFLPCVPLVILSVRDIVRMPARGVQAGIRIYCLFGWISLSLTLLARYWMLL